MRQMPSWSVIAAVLAAVLCPALRAVADTARDLALVRDPTESPGERIGAAARLGEDPAAADVPGVAAALETVGWSTGEADAGVAAAGRGALERIAQRRPADAAARVIAAGAQGASPEALARGARALLDPLTPPAEVALWVARLAGADLGAGSPLAPLIEAAREPGGTHRVRARVMLTAVLGVREADVMVELGPIAGTQSFAEMAEAKIVRPLREGGWERQAQAEGLARSERAEFRALGGAMLRMMVEANKGDGGRATAERRAAALVGLEIAARPVASVPVAPFRAAARPTGGALAMTVPEPARDVGVVNEQIVLTEATRARRYDPDTVLRCLRRLDDSDAEIRAAAHGYWNSMVVRGVLEEHAVRAVARVLPEVGEPQFGWALGHLEKAPTELRWVVDAVLLRRVILGDRDATLAVGRIRSPGAEGAVEVARMLARSSGAQQEPFARWLTEAVRGEQYAGPALAPLLSDEDQWTARAAARLAAVAPDRLGASEAVALLAGMGKVPPRDLLAALVPDPATVGDRLAPLVRSTRPESRKAALRVLAAVGARGDDARAAVEAVLRAGDEDEQGLAAEALGTEEATRIATGAAVLRGLRAADPSVRSAAAHRAARVGLAEPAVTAALVRAVGAGDLAAREGLILALERSAKAGGSVADVLATADEEGDATKRAYLRAARRAVGK